MNKKELLEAIKDCPDDMEIVVDYYERGVTKECTVSVEGIYEYKGCSCGVYGEFITKHDMSFKVADPKPKGFVIYISRYDKEETR